MTPENDRLEDALPAGEAVADDVEMVPIFSSTGALAEMEALAIQGILEANEIPFAVTAGTPTLPVVEFVVSVPADRLAQGNRAIAEAQAAGPAAAEEAELAGEQQGVVRPD